jgi:hypothetical protein
MQYANCWQAITEEIVQNTENFYRFALTLVISSIQGMTPLITGHRCPQWAKEYM